MNNFSYKEPYLYRDEDNKKWCVRYAIKYVGEKNYTHLKEYGRLYLGKSLNSISDLPTREKEFQKLLLLVEMDLKAGIDIKRPETIKAKIEEEVREAKRKSYEECFKLFLTHKGYIKPIPKKEMSAVTHKTFHSNQFKPFLEEKGLLDDISLVTKAHLLEFFNRYYLNTNPNLKWSNNTYNNKKGLLSSFFSLLVDEDIISENPVKKIKNKPSEATERFAVFTKEERDLLFTHFDKGKYTFMSALLRVIYYAYIRKTEISRLRVKDFDLENRTIRIKPEIAKGQRDNLARFVKIAKPLEEVLRVYLSKYQHEPDWYIFGKRFKPSPFQALRWEHLFRDALQELKSKHPNKFNREGLSPYCLKHSGVTDFVNDNAKKFSTTELFRFVQKQCRHEQFSMTEKYLKKLEINTEAFDKFDFI